MRAERPGVNWRSRLPCPAATIRRRPLRWLISARCCSTPTNSCIGTRSMYSRRDLLRKAGSGLGSIALASMLDRDGFGATAPDPLAPKPPHFKPTAKSVIWLFMEGGPSHLDLFDPKPLLDKLAGQPMPESFGH